MKNFIFAMAAICLLSWSSTESKAQSFNQMETLTSSHSSMYKTLITSQTPALTTQTVFISKPTSFQGSSYRTNTYATAGSTYHIQYLRTSYQPIATYNYPTSSYTGFSGLPSNRPRITGYQGYKYRPNRF